MFRAALVVPNTFDLWNFRRPLIKALQEAGAEVAGIAPPGPWAERVTALGCTYIPWRLDRRSCLPSTEAGALAELHRILAMWHPTIVQLFTIKPNIYGAFAARAAGVPTVVLTVTGLGYFWTETSFRARLARRSLAWLYRRAIGRADAVVYLNEDDRQALGEGRVTLVLPGEGVDLGVFHPQAVPPDRLADCRKRLGLPTGAPVVLMLGRMLRHKGVAEFAAAASRVRRSRPEAVFLLVGPRDDGNPTCVSGVEIQRWVSGGAVRYLGAREDVVELLALADIVILPSYREGMPRVLIEAAAIGKPLVATDVPGCREVVQHGRNGFLVPPRDAGALADAVEELLATPSLLNAFAQRSRVLAETRFNDRVIALQILDLYRRLIDAKGLTVPPGLAAVPQATMALNPPAAVTGGS